ncbi:family 20 glycosylhydrolase [Arthrobacter sp. NPDC080073]|uniref:family 20 glycosylhydrolase n=1 Tax=Arthrobacter sp. NPDC080073 TaxID=3155919 RepID=UPI00342FB8FF
MIDATDAGVGEPRWLALPQPTTAMLTGGEWRPAAVRVVAEAPEFAGEAVRLERELRALGIASGEEATVRLRRGGADGEAFSVAVNDDVEVVAGAPVGVFRACRQNEGFRLESASFPEIVSADRVTRDQARRIVEVAADLHLDLVPSLDMPGHLRHVLTVHPEFRLPSGAPGTDHALDITRDEAERFAQALIDDMAPVFSRSTCWNLGGDEFVDFSRIEDYRTLSGAALERYGEEGTGFDLLTDFINRTATHLRSRGFAARVWNDGMLRSRVIDLDRDIVLTWWTNWDVQIRPLAQAVTAGYGLVNFNDSLFYYVLGEKAGYSYPTSERVWEAGWHPGLFPPLPGGARQEIAAPYPAQLRGVSFSVWSDAAEAQTPGEVFDGIRRPLRATAERAWNGGSRLMHTEFCDIDARIGVMNDATGFSR